VILGIDAAKNRTGWALLTDAGVIVNTGTIVIDHKDGDIRRAFQMVRDELVDIDYVAQHAAADVLGVFVEAPFAGPSPKVTVAHALWCGAVTALASHVFGHALIELLPPREWRQILGIKGTGKPPITAWAVERWPHIAGRTQDEIDAACIAEAARRKVEVVA
jgi:hypothetical protein